MVHPLHLLNIAYVNTHTHTHLLWPFLLACPALAVLAEGNIGTGKALVKVVAVCNELLAFRTYELGADCVGERSTCECCNSARSVIRQLQ